MLEDIKQLIHFLGDISYMVDYNIEVFLNDSSIVGKSFYHYLDHLAKVLKRYEECNLVLNSEKLQFMGKERIILGHTIF